MRTLLATALLLAPQDPGTSYRLRVADRDPARRAALMAHFGDEAIAAADGAVEVIVMPEEMPEFERLGLQSVTLLDRGRPFHQIRAERQRLAPAAPDANYYTVAEIEQKLQDFETQYPAIARKLDVTAFAGGPLTHDGRRIFGLRISDNAATREDEPAIVIAAQHHARELNSTHIVIGAAQRILQAYAGDAAIRAIVDSHELYLIPCVNPDGTEWVWNVDNNWRKNRRNSGTAFGVDNNRNYAFLWSSACGGSTSPSSDTYRGPAAVSEPETQVMDRLGALLRPEKYLDFHSSGQEVLNTYDSCATAPASVVAMLNAYRDDLRGPMNYGFRDPSAAGEAPEHHFTRSGTLSFLTEISTSFQPAWSVTVAEEARVWPGLRRALDWRPALRGHVRSVCGDTPIAAEILVPALGFTGGERNVAEAAFGRYKAWLPVGTWAVTFRAAGYADSTTTVTVSALDVTQTLEVWLTPGTGVATLAKTGSERIGTPVTLTYRSPGDAGRDYWIPMALGSTPGLPLGPRTLLLNPDALFLASLNLAPVLVGNLGNLPPGDTAAATFNIPPVAALVGLPLWFAGITLDPGCQFGVRRFSDPVSVVVQP